jgi:hypothetical protein
MSIAPDCAVESLAPRAALHPKARDVFAHEFMHVVQCAFSRRAQCTQQGWVEEGTANWATQYFYATDNFERHYSFGYFAQSNPTPRMGITVPIDLDLHGTDEEQ